MPNVTEQLFESYIRIFHETLSQTAAQYLSKENRSSLLHMALLPAKITGYISTQFGVALEYEASSKTSITIVRGSARIEDLLAGAPKKLHELGGRGGVMGLGGENCRIQGVEFMNGASYRLISNRASVSLTDARYSWGAWSKYISYAEVNAIRTAEYWSHECAISRAKDEVLTAMVELNRASEENVSIDEYIARYKDKMVLVLGAYDEGGERRLNAITTSLKKFGYVPLLVRDIPDHPHQSLNQKVVAIGAVSRFVIIDDSFKSGHLVEVELCKQNLWVTAVLRTKGSFSSWMTAGISASSKVVFEYEYDEYNSDEALDHVCKWAEQTLKQLKKIFTNTYPWRQKS